MSDFVYYRPSGDFDEIFKQVMEGECPFVIDEVYNCKHCLFAPVCYHPNTLLYGKD